MLGGALLALGALGCQEGIAWRGYSFDPVHREAASTGKLTFVYFRNWYLVECTRFEDNVLRSRPVRDATADLDCVVLSFDADHERALQWGLIQPPAVAIVAPDGSPLAAGWGEMSIEKLLAQIYYAKDVYKASLTSQPAEAE